MSPEQIIKATDHAAQASDRWLFLFTLIVFLTVLGISIRWLVNYFTERQNRLESEIVRVREDQVEYLKTTGSKTLETLVNTQDVLRDCAQALTESAKLSERKLAVIQRLEERTR